MGLDMYAYVAAKAGAQADYNEGVHWDAEQDKFVNPNVTEPREIAYWRKHPNLHGWMHRLWESRGNSGDFNGDELELTWDDLEQLEQDIRNNNLPSTTGFFFGDQRDDDYREQDLQFVRDAKAEVFLGLKVFYNSSW